MEKKGCEEGKPKDEPGGVCALTEKKKKKSSKWRQWHERELPVRVCGELFESGMRMKISSKPLNETLSIHYPEQIWAAYPKPDRIQLLDNINYVFTAHFPFLLKGPVRLEYNTGYPHIFSWANQCFMRFLPAYWYLSNKKRGTRVLPMLRTVLNSQAKFERTKEVSKRFAKTRIKNIVLPFTFGKDSILSFMLSKEIGLNPTLVYFNEPTEKYSHKHKQALIKEFSKEEENTIHYLDNPLGNLREYGEGWFGWELALTSWGLLSLPFAHKEKARYILFSNEFSCNDFLYDDKNLKILVDYEQSAQAVEEMSLVTEALTNGEVYTTTFLQGLNEIAILWIIKLRYPHMLKYLMSCWAENESAKNKRWCGTCSKCARIYLFLLACGIDPLEAGYKENMMELDKERLFNVLGHKASGTGYDAFGTNTDEQLLAFYIAYLRGHKGALIKKFAKSPAKKDAEKRFDELMRKYLELQVESTTPLRWKKQIDSIFSKSLKEIRKEIFNLRKKNKK